LIAQNLGSDEAKRQHCCILGCGVQILTNGGHTKPRLHNPEQRTIRVIKSSRSRWTRRVAGMCNVVYTHNQRLRGGILFTHVELRHKMEGSGELKVPTTVFIKRDAR
jgi:hypothetical protein